MFLISLAKQALNYSFLTKRNIIKINKNEEKVNEILNSQFCTDLEESLEYIPFKIPSELLESSRPILINSSYRSTTYQERKPMQARHVSLYFAININ